MCSECYETVFGIAGGIVAVIVVILVVIVLVWCIGCRNKASRSSRCTCELLSTTQSCCNDLLYQGVGKGTN